MKKNRIRPVSRTVAILALAIGGGTCLPPVARAQNAPPASSFPPLARYFPGQDLVAYLELDGLDSHEKSWRNTAAHRLLNETTTGAMYRAALPRILEVLLHEDTEISLGGSEFAQLALHLFRSGFAAGINRAGGAGPPRCMAIVVRGAAKGEIHQLLDRILRAGSSPRSGVHDVQNRGRTIHQLGRSGAQSFAWWSEGDDLVISLVSTGGADAVIDAIEGKAQSAVENPTRAALLQSQRCPRLRARWPGLFRHGRPAPAAPGSRANGRRWHQAIRLSLGRARQRPALHRRRRRTRSKKGHPGALRSTEVGPTKSTAPSSGPRRFHGRLARRIPARAKAS